MREARARPPLNSQSLVSQTHQMVKEGKIHAEKSLLRLQRVIGSRRFFLNWVLDFLSLRGMCTRDQGLPVPFSIPTAVHPTLELHGWLIARYELSQRFHISKGSWMQKEL